MTTATICHPANYTVAWIGGRLFVSGQRPRRARAVVIKRLFLEQVFRWHSVLGPPAALGPSETAYPFGQVPGWLLELLEQEAAAKAWTQQPTRQPNGMI